MYDPYAINVFQMLETYFIQQFLHRFNREYNIYRIFTGNCGKLEYYIAGSTTHKCLKFLYLDYHSWTNITTNFQYRSHSFDMRNAS